jgi:hypothetical protein
MSVTGPTPRVGGIPGPAARPSINREILMAKKRTAKRATARKRAGAKPASKRRTKSTAKKASSSKKRATRARSARGPLSTVRVAGEKTWEALKSTTAQMVEGVKGTFGPEGGSNGR